MAQQQNAILGRPCALPGFTKTARAVPTIARSESRQDKIDVKVLLQHDVTSLHGETDGRCQTPRAAFSRDGALGARYEARGAEDRHGLARPFDGDVHGGRRDKARNVDIGICVLVFIRRRGARGRLFRWRLRAARAYGSSVRQAGEARVSGGFAELEVSVVVAE